MTPLFFTCAEVPAREWMVLKGGGRQRLALPVRIGLIERPDGLTLIDGGYGPEVFEGPRSALLRAYVGLMRPRLRPEASLEAVLARRGWGLADVRRVILTHFHADHVCALARLPHAEVIADAAALRAIRGRGALANLAQGIFAELLPEGLEERLTDIRSLSGIETPLGQGFDILGDSSTVAIPLPGHAEGHFGLCFQTESAFLYAADAQWLLPALVEGRLPGLPASLIGIAPATRQTAARLRAFHMAGGEIMLCHDPAPTRHDLP